MTLVPSGKSGFFHIQIKGRQGGGTRELDLTGRYGGQPWMYVPYSYQLLDQQGLGSRALAKSIHWNVDQV